jgi:hypothetical protein
MKVFYLLMLCLVSTPLAHGAEGCKQGNVEGCIKEYEAKKSVALLARVSSSLEQLCKDENKYCEYALITCDHVNKQGCADMADAVKNNEKKFRPFAEKACSNKDGEYCWKIGIRDIEAGSIDKGRRMFEQACRYENLSGCRSLIWPKEQTTNIPRSRDLDEKGFALAKKLCEANPKGTACRAVQAKLEQDKATNNVASPQAVTVYKTSAKERTPQDHMEVCKNGVCCRVYAGGLTVEKKQRTHFYGQVSSDQTEDLLNKAWTTKEMQRNMSGHSVVPSHSLASGTERNSKTYLDLGKEPKKSALFPIEKSLLKLCKSAKKIAQIGEGNDATAVKELIQLIRSDVLPAWAFNMSYYLSYSEQPSSTHQWWLRYANDSVISKLEIQDFDSGKTLETVVPVTFLKEKLLKILERTQLFLQTFGPSVSDSNQQKTLSFKFGIEIHHQRIGYRRNIPDEAALCLTQVQKLLEDFQSSHKSEAHTDPWDAIIDRWKKNGAISKVGTVGQGGGTPSMTVQGFGDLSPKANENLLQSLRSCVIRKTELKQELGSNLDVIRRKVRLTPVKDPDRPNTLRGFKVTELEYESVLGVTGLRDGDLLVDVGGIALDHVNKSDVLFQELKNKEGNIEFAVVREEKRRTFRCVSVDY